MRERLQKILSAHGAASRRAAEVLIARGKVTVNGQVASVGDSADAENDAIEIDGRPLSIRPEPITILLHKPRGVVTTLSDEKGRKTVRDLLTDIPDRLVPVGRLDMNTEGLLLLTNDGALVQTLTHPSHEIDKEYHVGLKSGDMDAAARALAQPMTIEGYKIQPAKTAVVRRDEGGGGVVSVTIHEGRHHQVRLMCQQAELEVVRLRRVRLGPLSIEGVPYGHYRKLTPAEVKKLHPEHADT
ncbi:MAG: rRNA pseudouridine synthase [Oscillospiraceae bacterium]|jgi:23S rRNA pseudouridine2605 synthase|nr:rRNA pseudouridine synthase [Oscillospiraceae bacterium]